MSDPNNNEAGGSVNASDPWDMDFAGPEDSSDEPAELETVEEDSAGEPSAEEESGVEAESETTEEPTEAQSEDAAKRIVAKLGDKLFEIPADAKFTVKVRGQDVEMTAQDVINRSSGDYDIQNKYNELNTERQKFGSKIKAWEKDSAEWSQFTSQVMEKINTKNPDRVIEAFDQIIDRMGGDPIMFKNEFVRSLLPLVQKYQSMTESERALYDRDLQIEAERKIRERTEAKYKKQIEERERQEFDRSVEAEALEGMQKYGVSEDEFVSAYERAKSLQESGALKRDITPNDVFYIAVEDRARSGYQQGIKEIAPSIASDPVASKKYEDLLLDRVLFDMNRGALGTPAFYKEWLKKEIGSVVTASVAEKTKHSRSTAKKPLTSKKPIRDKEVFDKNFKINWD